MRSRALPAGVASFLGIAAITHWSARRLLDMPSSGANALLPVVVLAPLPAAGIGTGPHTYRDDLDRTAVRARWPRRLVHPRTLTAGAAALPALALPGHSPDFGWSAVVSNVLWAAGIRAAGAALPGARLSRLPTTVHLNAVHLAGAPREPGRVTGAGVTAGAVFVLGCALHA